jgi:hypothetical protein
MSLTALSVLGLALATGFGVSPTGDEGTAAHLWQLLVAAQLPVIAYFAVRWFRVAPHEAGVVIAVQICALVAAAAPVFLLHL